jgi:hypothetical protein
MFNETKEYARVILMSQMIVEEVRGESEGETSFDVVVAAMAYCRSHPEKRQNVAAERRSVDAKFPRGG